MEQLGEGVARPVVAVDLGGTHTRVALVRTDGTILARAIEDTALSDSHPDNLVALIAQVASDLDPVRAVLGVPGRVDYAGGRLEYAPNLPPHWATHLTEARLSAATGLDVALANDADLATVGEHRFGAGRGVGNMVYVTLSTGVGCGVILGNRLARGDRSIAEAGHAVIDLRAEPGRRTFEETASGTAMNRLAGEASLTARGPALLELALAGDERASAVWEAVVAAAGVGIANLAHLYSPELIVLGGGLGLAGEPLYGPLRDALLSLGPKGMRNPIRIVSAALGDDAGLIGAAGWTTTNHRPRE